MKRILTIIIPALLAFTSCGYDDADLWNAVDDLDDRLKTLEQTVSRMNTEVSSLQTLVDAIDSGYFITDFTTLSSGKGYSITLSNEETIEIYHGTAGADAPVLGTTEIDGVYYWAYIVDGEAVPLEDGDGNYLPVTGTTPVLSIDDEGYWMVDYGNGAEYIDDGNGGYIMAKGGESMFDEVVDGYYYVTFYMADGTVFRLPKMSTAEFTIESRKREHFKYEATRTFNVVTKGVNDVVVVNTPLFWTVDIELNPSGDFATLNITAPSQVFVSGNLAQAEGTIVISVYGQDGNFNVRQTVYTDGMDYGLALLTFEDDDYNGSWESTDGRGYWTSLIDSPQYGGPLLYGDYSAVDYNWYDEGNTELASELVTAWGSTVFWNGGIAVSNYHLADIGKGDFDTQLSIVGETGCDGSSNFSVGFGYSDSYGAFPGSLPGIYFRDGGERVVESIYVTSTTYFANDVTNGSSFSPALPSGGYVHLIAIGYDASGNPVSGTVQPFELATGAGGPVLDWQEWDLSGLGKVNRIEFNMDGSADGYNSYGWARPAYFAFDNVAVRFYDDE
ncbi:MAG: DUF4988 and DUF4465 domain-containing protein [Rikenellaceae bacterium]|nr:DUF4988 and DUF4465 domain-containing protein [Rikenellaceae bacterium]